MVATARPWVIAKRTSLLLACLGLAAAACIDNTRDFHRGHARGNTQGGQGGYVATGGQGGSAGSTATCSATTTPSFSVRWTLEDTAGAPANCTAVGAATMDLDVLDVATSAVSHDTFPCEAMTGTSATLAAGTYSVAMRLRDSAGKLLSEAIAPTTYPINAGCSTDLGLVPFEAVKTTATQYFTLSWTIDRVGTSAPLSCAQAHATTIELDAGATSFAWPCANGKAASGSLAPDVYAVAVKLLDATGTVLSATSSMPFTVTAGQPKALGTVTFDVN
jgi:hypothetical protein